MGRTVIVIFVMAGLVAAKATAIGLFLRSGGEPEYFRSIATTVYMRLTRAMASFATVRRPIRIFPNSDLPMWGLFRVLEVVGMTKLAGS